MVDTMIRLFEANETTFTTNGLGSLFDACKCEIIEERNGSFELEMEYHISGKRYHELQLRRIIVAKPNPYDEPQPFRIYEITKPMNGLITVKAAHISYDMAGYPVLPFTAWGVSQAMSALPNKSIADCPFHFSTDLTSSGTFSLEKPTSMRSLLGGSDGSILDTYGGEYEFDGFRVILHSKRGKNRGVTIRYGKNMTDLNQEENCNNVYTAVYPFWYSDEWGLIELPEKTISVPGSYGFTHIYLLDLSSEWENYIYEWKDEYPTEDEIRDMTQKFISENKIGIPAVSLTVSFEQLSQSEEYAQFALLETVHLCDTVTVEFPTLGVKNSSKCIKTTYNVLTGKYISIELGEASSNLASAIVSRDEVIQKAENDIRDIKDDVGDITISLEKTTEGLLAEVSRATAAEGNLSSRITMTADNITAEVTRATSAEGSLSSRITMTADEISSKVSRGDVVSEINQSAEQIVLSSNRLVVNSTNFTLDSSGNATFSGNLSGPEINFYGLRSYNGSISFNGIDGDIKGTHLIASSDEGIQTNSISSWGGSYVDVDSILRTNGHGIVSGGDVIPSYSGAGSLGSSSYRWSEVYASKSAINTSDRRQKREIRPIGEEYEKLWFLLKPVSFQFNDGDRTHWGMISQDLEDSIQKLGLTAKDVAMFCKDKKMALDEQTGQMQSVVDENGDKEWVYSLRYGELISLNTHMLQKAYGKIREIERRIRELEEKILKISKFY